MTGMTTPSLGAAPAALWGPDRVAGVASLMVLLGDSPLVTVPSWGSVLNCGWGCAGSVMGLLLMAVCVDACRRRSRFPC
jgi:hypothetical protein